MKTEVLTVKGALRCIEGNFACLLLGRKITQMGENQSSLHLHNFDSNALVDGGHLRSGPLWGFPPLIEGEWAWKVKRAGKVGKKMWFNGFKSCWLLHWSSCCCDIHGPLFISEVTVWKLLICHDPRICLNFCHFIIILVLSLLLYFHSCFLSNHG